MSRAPRDERRADTSQRLALHLHSAMRAAQHLVANTLGVDETRRTETVVAMLENNRRRVPGYWIQLFLSMGIATLGLVLGSTAVVIGAMLVSPLMGPIIELGMGFAVGSSFLVLRAALRVALSVAVVVLGAALFTLGLPFQEITSEIASRTAPTALDLLVAMFCALTAAYTTVRPTSDTTSAAAGTAIGIALVPPLCTVGFGLGTRSPSIAGGAALLFTANLSAILVLAVVSFFVLGYNQVSAQQIEAGSLDGDDTRTDRVAARIHQRLGRVFGSRYGIAMRLLIPLTFLAAVYVPLRRALDEVTWEVRARDAIRTVVSAEAPRAVQTTSSVERHAISLRLFVVGTAERAADLERTLATRIASVTGVTPSVAVTAMPDVRTLDAATQARPPVGDLDLERVTVLRQHVGEALAAMWPSAAAGSLVGWDFVVSSHGNPSVIIRHVGTPLGPSGEALLRQTLGARVGVSLTVTDDAFSPAPIAARAGRDAQWLDSARRVFAWVSRADGAVACVRGPIDTSRRVAPARREVAKAIRSEASLAPTRFSLADSSEWSVWASAGACPAVPPSRP